MKQYTHAWLAFMAIKRLEDADFTGDNRTVADSLIRLFKNNKDGVIRGASYPDSVIKDNANSHVVKFNPAAAGDNRFKSLPDTYLMRNFETPSGLYQQPYTIDPDDNLPDRCESLAHSKNNCSNPYWPRRKSKPARLVDAIRQTQQIGPRHSSNLLKQRQL